MKARIAILSITILTLAGCSDINSSSPIEKLLSDGAAIGPNGDRVSPDFILNTDFLLLYMASDWSPASRAFTPKLVDYYKKESGGHLFQVLFISSDNGEREMRAFMKKAKMPWPAVVFHSKSNKILKKRYEVKGTPRLILLNKNGKTIADSFRGDQDLGPNHTLQELDSKLKKRKYDPVGLSEATGKSLPVRKKLEKKYRIEGLGGSASKRMAFINGKVYQKGAELDEGVKISSITDTYVEITTEGNRYKLKPKE